MVHLAAIRTPEINRNFNYKLDLSNEKIYRI